ncbi:unnamed protein product [Orchesella dallaii]|uniref:Tr-type G domain-containing protein n=1 Tax=Orchesella dallaii TaxID=48710 RepID=A0ABP1Q4F8_9HEXA
MRHVTPTTLASLQKSTSQIRNICILAHVDHGKTTLADSLVASNGIISQRLAGKLRYMDSRKDEQERGITMKSSAIALYFSLKESEDYLINLIDSPGHVDFSTEVSTAVRLCDGALIVVDVVEGICAQTIVSLRQAWQEEIKPVLVLNKMDRLILELKLTPIDAYVHLTQLLEKVNAVMAELLTSEVFQKDRMKSGARSRTTSKMDEVDAKSDGDAHVYDWSTGMDDIDDSDLYFSPEQGNVLFASAIDGWGFRIEDFVTIFSKKVGVKEEILARTLWGDFYLNNKLKRIMKGAQEKAKKPLFVQLVLENIWTIYDTVVVRKDKLAIEKMVGTLNLSIHQRDLRQNDPKQLVYTVMSNWLPLSKAILVAVCEKLPSPMELSEERVERLMLTHNRKFTTLPAESQELKHAFLNCRSNLDAPVIVFVSKMFAVDTKSLPENRPKPLSHEEMLARREQARQRIADKLAKVSLEETEVKLENPDINTVKDDNDNSIVKETYNEDQYQFIAFARVYSGTVRKNSKLYVLGPKHDPLTVMEKLKNGENIVTAASVKELTSGNHITEAEVKSLYILMGRDLETIDEVPAGNIIGIGGLDDHVLRTATLSSTICCPPFTDLNLIADPILRVAVEPIHTMEMDALLSGLKLLNQADPCVQILVQETGEHVLVTAGEVHLQRCLDDLRERFANIEISVSNPIVPFRETIVEPPKVDMVNELIETQSAQQSGNTNNKPTKGDDTQPVDGLITQKTANKKSVIKIRARPLPIEVVSLLEKSDKLLKSFKDYESYLEEGKRNLLSDALISEIGQFKDSLKKAFENSNWDPKIVQNLWSFGPKKCGPNILVNEISGFNKGSMWLENECKSENKSEDPREAFNSNFINGFQMATSSGPLCEEPMVGVCFIVEEWDMEPVDNSESTNQPFGPYSGQIMSAVKEGCRKAFQCQPQRLMVAMYSCNIQVNSEVLGKFMFYILLGNGLSYN